MGIPEEEKEKKRTEEIFEVIFLKLMTNPKPNPRSPGNIKHMNIKNKQQQQKNTIPRHVISKLQKPRKETTKESQKGGKAIPTEEQRQGLHQDFCSENRKARRE